ncbi:MAG: LysM peptidoglycan-binding domain-containing protein [Desulfobacterales bacterium]|nr:LysM peptidoglycan-binding domain-containing protein [Desulfobacterales bacterium]
MKINLYPIKIIPLFKLSIGALLLSGLLFVITGCASINGWTGKTASSAENKDRNSIAPVKLTALDQTEIEFLPLIPLNDESSEDDGAGQQDPADEKTDPAQSRFDKSLEFYQSAQDYWQQGELEKALDALDKAYAMIVNTETADDPKFSQQKDDLRFMISKRILEIYASRYTTVKGNHDAIPAVMNEHVKREIKRFTKGPSHDFFIRSYRRSGKYRPYILEELKKAGLPKELAWLPLVESGFKPKALSSARALGLWQFIASTGYKFGLKRDRYIDERLDPFKSTQAAIKYLKELHEIFGDWKTALAAYNCGAGRVLQVIRNQNINYLDDFWDLYQQLPRETARYVPKFMATLHIVDNLEKYGMADIEVAPRIEYEVVEMDKQASLKSIAAAIGVKEETLAELNPELRYKALPEDSYSLKVPAQKKETLLAKLDDIEQSYQSPYNIAYHRVRRGETLSEIAERYDTTIKKIVWYNNLYSQNYIVAGQRLKIPQAGTYAMRNSPSSAPKIIKYRVKRGDSLWVLAKRYNTTTKKIQKLNNLDSVNLHIGQTLKIPAGSAANLDVYRVKKGDSPFTIAKRHNMNLDRLLRINQLNKNSRIYPGQTLYVK